MVNICGCALNANSYTVRSGIISDDSVNCDRMQELVKAIETCEAKVETDFDAFGPLASGYKISDMNSMSLAVLNRAPNDGPALAVFDVSGRFMGAISLLETKYYDVCGAEIEIDRDLANLCDKLPSQNMGAASKEEIDQLIDTITKQGVWDKIIDFFGKSPVTVVRSPNYDKLTILNKKGEALMRGDRDVDPFIDKGINEALHEHYRMFSPEGKQLGLIEINDRGTFFRSIYADGDEGEEPGIKIANDRITIF